MSTSALSDQPPAPTGARAAETARRGGGGRAARRRRLALVLLTALAFVPVGFVLVSTSEAHRNIVYGEEFDTALAFVLRLREGLDPGAFLREIFAQSGAHRTATSRLLFAASYWLTGTLNFAVIDWIGIGSILAVGGLLVATAGSSLRRVRLGLLFALLVFQLEHYANYLSADASLEHCLVVLLAAAAIVGAARANLAGTLVGAGCATLATFTLAHGLVIWPVGAVMLWARRRRREFAIWVALGVLATGAFFTGFALPRDLALPGWSLAGVSQVCHYWLALLGAVPALGHETVEPIFGLVLLVGLAYALARGVARREPIALPLAAFALGAAALIALGRAEVAGGEVLSRYYLLSALAWALVLFMLLERHSHPRRPLQLLVSLLPGLLAFNLVANRDFRDETDSWLEARDRAATRFQQQGVDGRELFSLYPNPQRSTELLRQAEQLGVYRLGPICRQRPFPAGAIVSNRLAYFVDEMTVDRRAVFIRGWVGLPGVRSARGQIHLVLRSSQETLLFSTVSISRPDVAAATKRPEWMQAGFRFARRRDRLPSGEFQLGFLVTYGGKSEYIMSAHRLTLVGEGQALLATGG